MRNPCSVAGVALVPLLVLAAAACAPAQPIRPSELRTLFGIPVEKLSPEGDLKATWPFEKADELRAFRKSEGIALHEGGGLRIAADAELTWQELAFERATLAFELWLEDAAAEFSIGLLAPGAVAEGTVVLVNTAVEGKTDRVAAIHAVRQGGLEAPGAEAPGALAAGQWHALAVSAQPGRVELTLPGRPAIAMDGAHLPATVLVWMSPDGGAARIRRLRVDGRVHLASLRKLVAAGEASRSGERRRAELRPSGGEVLPQLLNEERKVVLDALIQVKERRIESGTEAGEKLMAERNRSVETLNDILKDWSADDFPGALGRFARVDPAWFEPGAIAYLRGIIESDAGRDDDAVASFEAAARQRKKFPEPLRAAAVVHLGRRNLKRAEASLTQARAASPDDPWTMAFQGMFHLENGNVGSARTVLEVAAEKLPSSEAMKHLLAFVKRLGTRPRWETTHKKATKWYELESGVPGVVDGLASGLELYRAWLEREMPLGAKQKKPARVWVFDAEEEYLSFTDTLLHRAEQTAGCYLPSISTFLLFSSLDPVQDRAVLFHEAFHHYLHLAVEDPPPWFNEGLAEYFGATTFDEAGTPAAGGLHQGRLPDLQAALESKKLLPIEPLMLLDHEAFMKGEEVGLRYAQSWALVHWFKHGADPAAAGLFKTYTQAVVAGKTAADAWKQSFGGPKSPGAGALRDAFVRHVESVLLANPGGI